MEKRIISIDTLYGYGYYCGSKVYKKVRVSYFQSHLDKYDIQKGEKGNMFA